MPHVTPPTTSDPPFSGGVAAKIADLLRLPPPAAPELSDELHRTAKIRAFAERHKNLPRGPVDHQTIANLAAAAPIVSVDTPTQTAIAVLLARGAGRDLPSEENDAQAVQLGQLLQLLAAGLAEVAGPPARKRRPQNVVVPTAIDLLAQQFERCTGEKARDHFTTATKKNRGAPAYGDFWELAVITLGDSAHSPRALADAIHKTLPRRPANPANSPN